MSTARRSDRGAAPAGQDCASGYLSADLRDHVMGKQAWQAIQHHDRERFELSLLFDVGNARRVDGKIRRDRRPVRVVARPLRCRGRRAHRRRRPRPPRRSFDSHQGREAGNPRPEAGARADHARRELPARWACRRSTSSSPTISPTSPANQAFMLETLLPMEGCVYPWRHVSPASDASRFTRERLGIAAGRLRHRRVRQPAEAVAALPRAVARRAGARAAREARVLSRSMRRSVRSMCASRRQRASLRIVCCSCRRDATNTKNQSRYALVDVVLDTHALRRRQRHAGGAGHGRAGRDAGRQAARGAIELYHPRQSRCAGRRSRRAAANMSTLR